MLPVGPSGGSVGGIPRLLTWGDGNDGASMGAFSLLPEQVVEHIVHLMFRDLGGRWCHPNSFRDLGSFLEVNRGCYAAVRGNNQLWQTLHLVEQPKNRFHGLMNLAAGSVQHLHVTQKGTPLRPLHGSDSESSDSEATAWTWADALIFPGIFDGLLTAIAGKSLQSITLRIEVPGSGGRLLVTQLQLILDAAGEQLLRLDPGPIMATEAMPMHSLLRREPPYDVVLLTDVKISGFILRMEDFDFIGAVLQHHPSLEFLTLEGVELTPDDSIVPFLTAVTASSIMSLNLAPRQSASVPQVTGDWADGLALLSEWDAVERAHNLGTYQVRIFVL